MDGAVGAAGVMAGVNTRVACTLVGGVVGRCLGGTEGGGIGGRLIIWRGAWRMGGFTGETLDGETVGGALGLQLYYSCWQLQCHHRRHHW
jgi:hypothetical protein